MSINSGGPAFGQVVELRCVRVEMNGDTEWEPEAMMLGGLSVRDYFASKAMQAVPMPENALHDVQEAYDRIASHAYKMADAMIRAREQK